MKEILYILLDQYADHEIPFLAQGVTTDEVGPRKELKYVNKIVAATMEPIQSIGGFRMLPDYTFDSMPKDYAALVLIGGYGWQSEEAEKLVPIVKEAIAQGRLIGAICNAASWMAKHGFLNEVQHTGNGLQMIQQWAGDNYTNAAGYINEQAVRDGNIVTSNGTGQLEFACLMLKALENDTPEMIDRFHMFYQLGMVELFKKFAQ